MKDLNGDDSESLYQQLCLLSILVKRFFHAFPPFSTTTVSWESDLCISTSPQVLHYRGSFAAKPSGDISNSSS